MHPLLIRLENFDGSTISLSDQNLQAGIGSDNVHRIVVRSSSASALIITTPGGGLGNAVLVTTTATGFFGPGEVVDRNGLTRSEYLSELEWMVDSREGTWLQVNVPTGVWTPFGTSEAQHSLTSWPGTGTNRYRFQIRRGGSILFNRTYSWAS